MSKSEKQAFLRTAVKDKGYNPIKFIKFLEEDEDKEYELDNWNLEELQVAVKKFIKEEEEADDDQSVSSTDTDAMGEVFGKEPSEKAEENEESSEDESDENEEEEEAEGDDHHNELTGALNQNDQAD